jgi:hypothetical protein
MVAVLGTIGLALGASAGAATAVGGVVVAGATAGVVGSVKAGNAAKKSARLQQQAADLQSKRQRRAAIRSNMIASARSRASAEGAGVSQSSGLQGAVGSGQSQLSGALGYSTQQSGIAQGITNLGIKQQKYSQISKLGFQAMSFGMSTGGQDIIDGADYLAGDGSLFGGNSFGNASWSK